MKYRMLRKDEKPDKAKGDQYRTPGCRREIWQATSLRGHRTVAECNNAGNPCVYRRPANASGLRTGDPSRDSGTHEAVVGPSESGD